jgi:hypothetical protein
MARYIDADAFLEKMKKTNRYFDVKFDIENFPTVDVVPKSEVDKIFEEIETLLSLNHLQGDIFIGKYFDCDLANDIAELKKKYRVKK